MILSFSWRRNRKVKNN